MASFIINEEAIGGEIAVSLSASISSRVAEIRILKEQVNQKRVESGIEADEQRIEVVRGELLELASQYRDHVGKNWEDDQGFAQFRQSGEQHRYDRDSVDEALAKLTALRAEMARLAPDSPAEAIDADGLLDAASEGATIDIEEALSQLEILSEAYKKAMQEMNLRINAMSHELAQLAAARKTSAVKASVAVK